MNPQIVIEHLSFSYGSNKVLNDINLDVAKNEVLTIAGPNGGGKTTLLRLISGLLLPNQGRIQINEASKRQRIGYVPQYSTFDKKYPITLFEVVLSGLLKSFGFYTKEERLQAQKVMHTVGIESLQNRLFNDLSGGQRQRGLVARALLSEPKILLLDEPTSSIDEKSSENLAMLLKSIKGHQTIVLVTHDLDFLSDITNRVVYINKEVIDIKESSNKMQKEKKDDSHKITFLNAKHSETSNENHAKSFAVEEN